MELNKIEKLLESYFEGTTNLDEEAILMDYFNHQNVTDHLLQYKPIFVGLSAARNENSTRDFKIEDGKPSKIIKPWWYAVAGMLVIALGIGSFFLSQPQQMSQEEKEALMAFENSKKAMMLLSDNLNKGAHQLYYVDKFTNSKDKIWKETLE